MEWVKKDGERPEWVLSDTPYFIYLTSQDMTALGGSKIWDSKLFLDLDKTDRFEEERERKMDFERTLAEEFDKPMSFRPKKVLMILSVNESREEVIKETDNWTKNNRPPDITFLSELDEGDGIEVETSDYLTLTGEVEEFRRLDTGESEYTDLHILCSSKGEHDDFVINTTVRNLESCRGSVHVLPIDEYEEYLTRREIKDSGRISNMLDNPRGQITGLSILSSR